MLRKSFKAGAAVIGGTMLAATILTGCAGGPKVTLGGTEVSNLDKAIESADNAWAQKRASGTASNVDKDSRCYAQTTSDGVLAKQAICGPIHYLGQDDQVWETMDWQPAPDGKDKVQVSADNSFSTGTPAPNTTLYRTDGKKAPDGLQVPEPDTKTAEPGQAIWGLGGSGAVTDLKTAVEIPDASISLSEMKISDRVGYEKERLKAGDGNKFVYVYLEMTNNQNSGSQADLAFISGGKTYPAGKAKSGRLAMVLPGDAKDAVLAITYDGLTQKVSIADGKLESKATAYYDGLSGSASSSSLEPFTVGNRESGTSVVFQPEDFQATRTAYEPKAGWAPEGKAWLVVTGSPNHESFQDKNSDGRLTYSSPTKITTATVKNVSGTAFSADAKRIDNVVDSGFFFGSTTKSTVVFEVPAGVGDFSVAFTLSVSGAADSTSSHHPPTASLDGTVPPFELTFKK
jgi:hypothetical protein